MLYCTHGFSTNVFGTIHKIFKTSETCRYIGCVTFMYNVLVNTLKILLIRIHSLHNFPKPVPKYKNVNKYI